MSGATIGSELPLFVVPYRQNVNFTGREEQLRQIEQQLDAAQGHVRLVVAGLGGLGKTQLALEYSYRQRDAYDLVYWLKAGEPAALGAGLSALAGALGLIGVEIGDQEALRRQLFAWLERTEARWLLVYDIADTIKPGDLENYLPRAGNGHVLITSRNPRWRSMATVLELGVFEPGEAAAFLKKRTGRDDEQGAAELAEALGYVPLALEHAAAYIEETGAGFAAYREYHEDQREALWADAEPPDAYNIVQNIGEVGGTVIGVELTPGARSLEPEQIRLDVAHPEQAFVDEPFELAVAVRQPDAPPISVEELTRVVSEEGTVYRPADEEVIRYRIEVSGGDDWEIDPPSYDILLRRGENGPPRFFQVTALRQGRGTLLVNAYQEDQALAAQTRIRIEVQIPVEKKIDPTHEQEVHQMDIILTPAEAEQFHEALLAAFNRSELKQVVYFSLETPYEEIVASGAFSSEVYSLVLWVNKQNKVMALLKEARERNEGNVELREFEEAIVAKYAIGPAEDDQEEEPESETPEQDPRKALIDELLRLPVATTQAGRTSLLHGIPGANTLNRDMNIARLDLDLIVTQLAERGRLANGQLALVMLIDNALPYAEGFEAEPRLKKIRQQLLAA